MEETVTGLAFVASTDEGEKAVHGYATDVEGEGGLEHLGEAAIGEDASYLAVHPDEPVVYAVGATDGGTAHALAVDPGTGALSALGERASGSEGPCYCSVDPHGECLLVAHYQGGSVSALPLGSDGAIEGPARVVEHDSDDAHPHAIVPHPDADRISVPDLGTDEVVQYELDREEERLDRVGTLPIHDGAGPRHLVFHPSLDLAYLLNERDSTLVSLDCRPTGELRRLRTVDTLPEEFEGENYPADVHVHPNGRYVYASNRGHDSVAIFRTDEDGGLDPVDHEPTRGEWPRDVAVAPNGRFLYVENRDTDTVVAFAVDGTTGRLTPTGATVDLPDPTCMTFYAAASRIT